MSIMESLWNSSEDICELCCSGVVEICCSTCARSICENKHCQPKSSMCKVCVNSSSYNNSIILSSIPWKICPMCKGIYSVITVENQCCRCSSRYISTKP